MPISWDDQYSCEGFLWIMQPRIVFQARLNAPSAAYPLAQIAYDGVTTGAYTDLKMGMLMALGSAPGKFDYGMNYLRGTFFDHSVASATTLNVGYCSRGFNRGELNLVDNCYLTVWDCYPPFKRPSRMANDGSIYKDYDWPITPSTSPVAHVGDMGGIGNMEFVDGSGYFPIQFNAGGSYPTGRLGTPSIFVQTWDAADGIYVTGNSASVAPKIKFPPGYRHVSLDVGDTTGEQALPRKYLVAALDGESDPALIQTLNKATWTLKPEGVSFQAEVRQRLDPALYLPGSPVMFLVREFYNGVEGSLTGWRVKFSGYLQYAQSFGRSTDTDFERAQTIYAVDAAIWLATEKAMPATMARVTLGISPSSQNALTGANLDAFVWWYLFNYTNAPMLTDFQWSDTADDYAFSNFSSPGGNLYSAPDNLARGIAYRLTHDSRGRLRMKPDPQRLNPADRTNTVLATLDQSKWQSVTRTKRPLPRLGVMRATFTPTSTTPAASVVPPVNDINAISPGIVEGQMNAESQNAYPWLAKADDGAQEGFDRLGHDYERQNAPEDDLQLLLAHGGDNGLEPAEQAWVTVSIGEDEVIGIDDVLTNERCLLVQTDFVFLDDPGTLQQTVTVERETVGTPAAIDPRPPTGAVPTTVTITDPNLQPVQTLPAYTGTNLTPTRLIVFDAGSSSCHVALAWDSVSGTIVYVDCSTGLSGVNHWSCSDPSNYKRYFALQSTGLYKNDDPFGGGTWSLVANNNTIFGSGSRVGKFLAPTINRQGYLAILSGNVYCYSTDSGATWTRSPIGGAASYQTALGDLNLFAISPFNSSTEGWIYANISGVGFYKSTNWGATWTLLEAFTGSGTNAFIGAPAIPYIRTDGVTQNSNDASQQVFCGRELGNEDGYLFSNNAAVSWTLVYHVNASGNRWKAVQPLTGWVCVPFTYDGSKLSIAGGNQAGGGSAWTRISNDGGASAVDDHNWGLTANTQGGGVNRYPYHAHATLHWIRDFTTLDWTLDDGTTWYSAAAPGGYTGVSYVEWSLSAVVVFA